MPSYRLTTVLPVVFGGVKNGKIASCSSAEPALTGAVQAAGRQAAYTTVERLARIDGTPTLEFLKAHHDAADVVVLERTRDGLRAKVYARDPSAFGPAFARHLGPLQVALATGLPVGDIKHHVVVPVAVRDAADISPPCRRRRPPKASPFSHHPALRRDPDQRPSDHAWWLKKRPAASRSAGRDGRSRATADRQGAGVGRDGTDPTL